MILATPDLGVKCHALNKNIISHEFGIIALTYYITYYTLANLAILESFQQCTCSPQLP